MAGQKQETGRIVGQKQEKKKVAGVDSCTTLGWKSYHAAPHVGDCVESVGGPRKQLSTQTYKHTDTSSDGV